MKRTEFTTGGMKIILQHWFNHMTMPDNKAIPQVENVTMKAGQDGEPVKFIVEFHEDSP